MTNEKKLNCYASNLIREYDEGNECWEPTGKCIIHDYWIEEELLG